MTTTTWLAIATIGVPALIALLVAMRQGKSADKTGMAAQYTALAERLRVTEERLDSAESKLNAAEEREATEHREAEKWRQVSVALWGVIVKNGQLEVPPWVETQLREAGMIL